MLQEVDFKTITKEEFEGLEGKVRTRKESKLTQVLRGLQPQSAVVIKRSILPKTLGIYNRAQKLNAKFSVKTTRDNKFVAILRIK